MTTTDGAQRRMLPGPVGDLETARLASGAANVVAYIADPAAPGSANGSYAWAEAAGPGARPGAWTPGQLFGAALVTDATGAQVTVG